MFKKLILFSTMTIIGGCETINQANQCDPEKNYAISNPEAMEEYKRLKMNGSVNSYYYRELPTEPCYDTLCVSYIPDKIIFFEKYFDDDERKGVYTITAISNLEDENCMKESVYTKMRSVRYCYTAIKNKNDEVKSRYKYTYDKTTKGQTIITFYDLKSNIKLYEYSYQIFTTGALGGPGFGRCKKSKNNNPNYKFDAVSFPINN